MRLLVLAALAACSRANIGAPKPSTAVPVGPNAGGPGAAWDWRRQLNDVLPHVQVRVAPLTNLKLRKNIRWLSTLLSVGADYSTQQGVWSMKYSWEDSLIGGRLTLKGSELQLHKAWVFALGGASSLAATLRLRGAVDLTTGKTSARLGFRTEQASGAINIVEGVDLVTFYVMGATDAPKGIGNYWTSLPAAPTPKYTPIYLDANGGLSWTAPTATASPAATGSVTYDMPLELPPGWRITRDAKTRIVYFYNESTRETRQFRDPPPDSQEAYKLLVAGLPPPPPGAPVPFRRGSSSIIALSYAMRFVHKLKNMGKAGRESSGYI